MSDVEARFATDRLTMLTRRDCGWFWKQVFARGTYKSDVAKWAAIVTNRTMEVLRVEATGVSAIEADEDTGENLYFFAVGGRRILAVMSNHFPFEETDGRAVSDIEDELLEDTAPPCLSFTLTRFPRDLTPFHISTHSEAIPINGLDFPFDTVELSASGGYYPLDGEILEGVSLDNIVADLRHHRVTLNNDVTQG